ncbi:winged helix-turn-helix domain-containing protein [Burkholderia pyrrocinia]
MGKYLIEHRFLFDNHLMTLSHDGRVTRLVANEVELLQMLMQGTITKQAVIEQVWESKGMYVTEGSYHQLVRSLRLKLEEQGISSGMIKTLPRLGLKFVGALESVADAQASDVPVTCAEEGPDVCVPYPPAESEANPTTEDLAHEPSLPESSVEIATELPAAALVEARPQAWPRVNPERHRMFYYMIYGLIVVWASVLAWETFCLGDNLYQFRYQRTVDGIHYFSDGRMEQSALLSALKVQPPPGGYVYQIGLGSNDWLAVCPKSIYTSPELCESYFIEKNY